MAEPASVSGLIRFTRWGAARVLVVSLVVAALVVVAAVTGFRQYAKAQLDQELSDVEAVAVAKQAAVEGLVRERMGDAAFLSRLGTIWQSESQCGLSRPGLAQERLRNVVANASEIYSFAYERIWFLDTNLRLANPAEVRTFTEDEQRSLRDALDSRATTFINLHVNTKGTVDFGVAQPVSDGCGGTATPLGVVYFEVEARDALYPLLESWPSLYHLTEAVLIRQDGNEAVYLSPRRKAGPGRVPGMRRPLDNPAVMTVQALRFRTGRTMDAWSFEGERVIGAYRPIAGTDWVLMARISYDEAYAPIRAFGLRIAAIAGAVLVLVFGIAVFVVRLRTRALEASSALTLRRSEILRRANIDGFVAVDRDGRVQDANERLVRMTGYSLDELRGKPMAELVPDPGPSARLPAVPAEGRYAEFRFVCTWRRRDGSIFHADNVVIYEPEDGDGVFYGTVRDISQTLADQKRIEQLNRFYKFLSHVNSAVFWAKTTAELYEEVCRRAVDDGGFIAAWLGVVDEAAQRVVAVTMHGSLDDYIRGLEITTDPALATSHGPCGESVISRQVVYVDDFQDDPRTAPWHERALKYGIGSSASVPVLVGGRAVAALTFYGRERYFFDVEMRGLLEEAARNVSRGVGALEAETRSAASERRFARVFDASPLPIQIADRRTRRHIAINQAHQRTFGYPLEDIRSEEAWFAAVLDDPLYREQMHAAFEASLARLAIEDGPRVEASPEMRLRCRDGSIRTMRAYAAVVGDEIVTQWHDLTDLTAAMNVLREGEHRFRGVLERVSAAVFVVQDGRLAYANPWLCRLLDVRAESVLGRDTFEVFRLDDFWRQRVQQTRARLAGGEPHVNMVLPVHRHDGTVVMLSNHATSLPWDGRPAYLVVGEDITERHRTETRLADYIRQLEAVMEGSLEAVSAVVQLYDQATVGHERRVGAIACDIARELGWPEERLRTLRMAAWMHDIGRVALPMDVVSRPGPLTDEEYELVKTHSKLGYDILRHIPFPMPIAEIVFQHHERMDGSGYPQGLKGEQILPEARVVMVADVLEAMATDRAHRKAPGVAAALHELESHRGTAYDAEVVDALLRLVRQKQYVLPPVEPGSVA